jgi:NTP pyrophosphatase (non-canonical NTP hydrolase)
MKIYEDKQLKTLDDLMDYVSAENNRQINKFGIQEHNSFQWSNILFEEIGELAKAINEFEFFDGDKHEIFKEAIQSATLCLKIAEIFKPIKYLQEQSHD